MNDALKLLKFRPRSRRELTNRLTERGYDNATVQQVVEDLEKRRFINDAAFAKLWATNRMEQRGFGSRRVRQELKAKGLDESVIQVAVQTAAGETDEQTQALEVAQKYLRRLEKLELAVQKRRLWGFLARRGFPSPIITKVVASCGIGHRTGARPAEAVTDESTEQDTNESCNT